jgi:hypothetical protein
MANKKEEKKIELDIPALTQQQSRKMPEYKKEELMAVFDQLIFEGEFKEESTIKGKLKVEFRSRTAEETMEISKFLDSAEYKLLTTMQEQRAFLNLNKSLVKYQGRDLTTISNDEKGKFIRRLPTSILASLADSLAEFDRKVDLACREAEEGF